MAIFELLTDLPIRTRERVLAILDTPANERPAQDQAFIDARTPYLTNEVLRYDSNDYILEAEGNSIPTGYEGFKKGAFFRLLTGQNAGLYVNAGNECDAYQD